MKIERILASSILSPQKGGFLGEGFTHTLNAYNGCGFGATACGKYCYAQMLPNWTWGMGATTEWGHGIVVKENAHHLLRATLKKMKSEKRQELRVFMSTATDPYQPLEAQEGMTRKLLEVFVEYPDLGLLVIQTRSKLVLADMPIIQKIPYAWVSMTIETDDQAFIHKLAPGGSPVEHRFEAVTKLRNHNINTQIAVSPCLPYTPDFLGKLMDTQANRVIVDTLTDGDGARGARTAQSPLGMNELALYGTTGWAWRDTTHAESLYKSLTGIAAIREGFSTGWSNEGFCGIPSQVFLKQKGMF